MAASCCGSEGRSSSTAGERASPPPRAVAKDPRTGIDRGVPMAHDGRAPGRAQLVAVTPVEVAVARPRWARAQSRSDVAAHARGCRPYAARIGAPDVSRRRAKLNDHARRGRGSEDGRDEEEAESESHERLMLLPGCDGTSPLASASWRRRQRRGASRTCASSSSTTSTATTCSTSPRSRTPSTTGSTTSSRHSRRSIPSWSPPTRRRSEWALPRADASRRCSTSPRWARSKRSRRTRRSRSGLRTCGSGSAPTSPSPT